MSEREDLEAFFVLHVSENENIKKKNLGICFI